MTILQDILARKKQEIAALPPCSAVRSPRRSFVAALQSRRPSFIAEVKPTSPLGGQLIRSEDIPAFVTLYSECAQAISVLCDTATFGGGFDLLAHIRTKTNLPLLAKDFIVDERQIDAATTSGADAVLLIVSLVSDILLLDLVRKTLTLGLDILLEVHTEDDVMRAHNLFSSLSQEDRTHIVLGINNRDLASQTIDLGTTTKLAALVRDTFSQSPLLVSESGIATPKDVVWLQDSVQGFLIGTAFLCSSQPRKLFYSLLNPS